MGLTSCGASVGSLASRDSLGRELSAGSRRRGPAQGGPGRWGRAASVGANTVGGIVGSLAASLLLIAWIGSRHTQQALIAASAISGLLALASLSARCSPAKIASLPWLALAVSAPACSCGAYHKFPVT